MKHISLSIEQASTWAGIYIRTQLEWASGHAPYCTALHCFATAVERYQPAGLTVACRRCRWLGVWGSERLCCNRNRQIIRDAGVGNELKHSSGKLLRLLKCSYSYSESHRTSSVQPPQLAQDVTLCAGTQAANTELQQDRRHFHDFGPRWLFIRLSLAAEKIMLLTDNEALLL
jgi:hypothetical protein